MQQSIWAAEVIVLSYVCPAKKSFGRVRKLEIRIPDSRFPYIYIFVVVAVVSTVVACVAGEVMRQK